MAPLEIAATDWNNRLRDASISLASKIPEFGAAASFTLGIFWPVHQVNIFESIKQDIEGLVANLVDKVILAKELEERQNEIEALRNVIQEYHDMVEKRGWLTRWIADSNMLSVKLQKSSNNIHFILPTIALSLLHLLGLRERLRFGKEIYGEDNTAVWKNDLEIAYHDYVVVYFPEIYLKWKVWRADQVVIKKWVDQYLIAFVTRATVEDKVSGARQEYSETLNATLGTFNNVTNGHKTKICNDAYTDMAVCISTTFNFNVMAPDSKDPPYNKEVFGRMFLGPYADDLLPGRESNYGSQLDHNDYDANQGSLKEIVIRAGDSIDAMQFIYVNGAGRLAGNAQGGVEHKVDLMNKNVKGLCMGFEYGLLRSVQILYADGTQSETFGSGGRVCARNVVANGPPGYKLRSWSFGVNYSGNLCVGTLLLEYEIL